MSMLDRGYITAKNWMARKKEQFMADERGVSGIVAAIVLLVIAVVLAAVFWDKISTLVSGLWSKFESDGIDPSKINGGG